MSTHFPPPASRPSGRSRNAVRKGKRSRILTKAVRFLLVWVVAGLAGMNSVGAAGAGDCASPPANMVSWWKAEDNTNDSAGANQAALANGATYGTGRVGQAFSFDGVDDYAAVPASSAWAFGTGNFTVEFWIYRTTDDDRRPLINNRVTAGGENMWAIEIYSLANRVEFHSGQTILLQATSLLASASWNHVALTRSGTTLSFYINGVPSGSTSNANDFSEINDLQIGRDLLPVNVGDLGGKKFQGLLDEISFYNRGLSAAEIAAIHNAGAAGKCAIDVIPVPFGFTAQTGVPLDFLATSNAIIVAGINSASPISVVGGTYSINGEPHTAASGTISNGDSVALQQTSSGLYETTTTATLTIGGVSGDFNVTTQPGVAPSGCSVNQSPNTVVSAVIPGTPVTLSASCTGGSPPTSCAWSGGIASLSCSVTVGAPSASTSYSVTASNPAGFAAPVGTTIHVTNAFDVDGNGQVDALTDGLMLIRYMFGLRGVALTGGAIGVGATRTTAEIQAYLESVMP